MTLKNALNALTDELRRRRNPASYQDISGGGSYQDPYDYSHQEEYDDHHEDDHDTDCEDSDHDGVCDAGDYGGDDYCD